MRDSVVILRSAVALEAFCHIHDDNAPVMRPSHSDDAGVGRAFCCDARHRDSQPRTLDSARGAKRPDASLKAMPLRYVRTPTAECKDESPGHTPEKSVAHEILSPRCQGGAKGRAILRYGVSRSDSTYNRRNISHCTSCFAQFDVSISRFWIGDRTI
jgi:hypothetical protein